METVQLLLGLALLAVGVGMIVARHRLPLGDRAGASPLAVPTLWAALGSLLAVNGLLQVHLGLN